MSKSPSILNLFSAWAFSPVELRVYDLEGRVTGLVEGMVKEQIPNSVYFDNIVIVFSPSDSYIYKVAGTEDGTYRLIVGSVTEEVENTFTATDIPTSANAIHQYTVDWDALSRGEEGTTVQIDSDGDGTFEQTITAGATLAAPVADADGPYESKEGSSIAFDASASYDSDGDALEYRWDFDNDGSWDTEWSTKSTADHTYGDDYQDSAKLEVSDGDFTDTDTAEVTVDNVAPTVKLGSDKTATAGDYVEFSGSFEDSGWLDTHTATWAYGDETTGEGDVTEENERPDATGTVEGGHSYFKAGEYTVTLKVTDDDKGEGSDTLKVTVKPIKATIDFEPNTLNLKGKGKWVTAHIELPEGYGVDEGDVDGGEAILHAKIDFKKKPDNDKVRVQGKLMPDLVNNGDAKSVTVTIGLLSETVTMVEKGKKGEVWEYKRPKSGEGNIKYMTINWKSGRFDIRMDKAKLSGLTNPVAIGIQIGGGLFKKTILMNEKKDNWDYNRHIDWHGHRSLIDISTVKLNGQVPAVSDPKYGFVKNPELKDRDKNGLPELMVKFDRKSVQEILEVGDEVEITVTGGVEYDNGHDKGLADFEGKDTIRVIDKGKPEVAEDEGKGKPKAAPERFVFSALPPYPQPCNPDVWIPYTLAKNVEVTITIYSSAGRVIRTLDLGHQSAGAYIDKGKAAYWDGRTQAGERVTSGLYFYHLQAGDYSATKRMVILK